ncbi:universal stress protein [Oceaniglobus roseus]|uniref:universal stress protein n=1 Tax=Oceaniglobus roseus TaxID=1737570 RepID=UPI000C7EFB95|nr:universal stress protein [Kandeliimicrobium roseum]
MALKNILVAINGQRGSDAALAGAVSLQRHYDAHLTGLFAHGGSSLSHHVKPWMPKSVQEAILEADTRSHSEVRSRFEQICAPVPKAQRHYIDSGGPVQRTVAAYARLFDVTVVGMHDRNSEYGQSHTEIYPDRVAFDSGRPVLIFPPDHARDIFGGRAVVAWDGGRAAARALADAMQILETGKSVEIVSVGRAPFQNSLPGVDVAQVLDRHDIDVTVTELPRDRRSIADTLVEHCGAVGAGLLVMGAYEHSPLREGLIGGVTHDIALRARLPVLMSH